MFNEILLCLMIRKKIKNEQVLDFLEKNPDFFINNPNVLEKINFPLKIILNTMKNQRLFLLKIGLLKT